jgi:hypothetical protein
MPIVNLSTTSVETPVALPGQPQIDDTSLALNFEGTERTAVALAITGDDASAFVADLNLLSLEGSSRIATTGRGQGGSPNGWLTPLRSGQSYHFTITFTGPTSPPPQYLTATLWVSWLVGEDFGQTSVELVGTTAQITATVVATPFIPIDGSAAAILQIDFASVDYSTLNIEVGPSTSPISPPLGLTIETVKTSLPVGWVTGVVPMTDVPFRLPSQQRSKTVAVSFSVGDPGPPSGNASLQITDLDLPQLSPLPVVVPFEIVA